MYQDVTTRGNYYPDKSLATAAVSQVPSIIFIGSLLQNPPLFLHVTSTSKAGLEKAIAKIDEMMQQELPNLIDERRFKRRDTEQVERDEFGRVFHPSLHENFLTLLAKMARRAHPHQHGEHARLQPPCSGRRSRRRLRQAHSNRNRLPGTDQRTWQRLHGTLHWTRIRRSNVPSRCRSPARESCTSQTTQRRLTC